MAITNWVWTWARIPPRRGLCVTAKAVLIHNANHYQVRSHFLTWPVYVTLVCDPIQPRGALPESSFDTGAPDVFK